MNGHRRTDATGSILCGRQLGNLGSGRGQDPEAEVTRVYRWWFVHCTGNCRDHPSAGCGIIFIAMAATNTPTLCEERVYDQITEAGINADLNSMYFVKRGARFTKYILFKSALIPAFVI